MPPQEKTGIANSVRPKRRYFMPPTLSQIHPGRQRRTVHRFLKLTLGEDIAPRCPPPAERGLVCRSVPTLPQPDRETPRARVERGWYFPRFFRSAFPGDDAS